MKQLLLCSCLMLLYLAAAPLQRLSAQHITAQELLGKPPLEADYRISYGADSLHFGDLRLPEGQGPHPVAVLVHGGCWLSFATLQYLDRFAEALTETGMATWSLEYRRIDSPGGGWPNTFLDVAAGLDHLRELAKDYDLDLERVVIIGHSSGGHLATWAAARHRIPASSPLYSSDPLAVAGVVNIAGPADLEPFRSVDNQVCGGDVIDRLVGGTPEEVPAHYAVTSPARMLPLGVAQRLLTGADDGAVPPQYGEDYAVRAREAGDDVQMQVIPNAGHFELVAPWSEVWPVVPEVVLSLVREAK